MKTFATLAALCLTATFVGCQSTTDMSTVSPAAVSECGTDCSSDCCSKGDASFGAISEKSSECTGTTSSDCSACPYADKIKDKM